MRAEAASGTGGGTGAAAAAADSDSEASDGPLMPSESDAWHPTRASESNSDRTSVTARRPGTPWPYPEF